MATISRTGITDGSAIQSEHLTRIIDALDGTATTDVIATGSFTGSFDGIYTGTVVSASYAVTASHALTGVGGSGIFAQTGSYYATTNDLQITGSLTVTSGSGTSIVDFSTATAVSESAVNIATSLKVDGSFNTDYFLAESGSYNLEDIINPGGIVDIELKQAAPLFITLPSPSTYLGSRYTFTFQRNTPNPAAYVRFSQASTLLAATVIDVTGNSFMTKATTMVSSSLGTPTPETRIDLVAGKNFWHMNIVTEDGVDWYSA